MLPLADPLPLWLCSGQMILAQALLRHLLGAGWRWPEAEVAEGADPAPPASLAALLELFWDTPAGERRVSAFMQSILFLSSGGRPRALALALTAAACPRRAQRLLAAQPVPSGAALRGGARPLAGPLGDVQDAGSSGSGGGAPQRAAGGQAAAAGALLTPLSAVHRRLCGSLPPPRPFPLQGLQLGLTVAVLAESGGGAPLLVTSRFEAAFAAPGSGDATLDSGAQQPPPQQQQQQCQQQQHQNGYSCSRTVGAAGLEALDSGTLAVEAPPLAASLAALGSGRRGLLLLVPLVLGLGKVGLAVGTWLRFSPLCTAQ